MAGSCRIGELASTLPGIVPRGRAMTAQTRHHFTMLRQVNQLRRAPSPPRAASRPPLRVTRTFRCGSDGSYGRGGESEHSPATKLLVGTVFKCTGVSFLTPETGGGS